MTDAVEGMPGTWSHCGLPEEHGPHRHTVIQNEGPTDNVLCKGYPGDPAGEAPLGQIRYEANWTPGDWWRVVGRDGRVWCETSQRSEAEAAMREGDQLLESQTRTETRWVARESRRPR